MKNNIKKQKNELNGIKENTNFKEDVKRIYKSKIANIPTPGYSGHQSTYINPLGYLNKDKILSELEDIENQEKLRKQNIDNETISGFYQKKKDNNEENTEEVNIINYYFYLFLSYLMLLVMEDIE
jgi:hypothetical protein